MDEQNTKYAGMEFTGIASDVIEEVIRQRNTWRAAAFLAVIAEIVTSGILAAVVLM